MKRFPWEATLTPEEAQEIVSKALEYEHRLTIYQWVMRVTSTAFFIWLMLGLLSVISISSGAIALLSFICIFPPQGCGSVAEDQRVAGFKRLEDNHEIVIQNKKVARESMSLYIFHIVVMVIALICH